MKQQEENLSRLLDGDEDSPKLEHAFWFDEDELPTVC